MDGVSDICTKGGDINFVFTGFSVNGKVWPHAVSLMLGPLSLGKSSPPETHRAAAGVFVHLALSQA